LLVHDARVMLRGRDAGQMNPMAEGNRIGFDAEVSQ
jgi:hypothetical protein